VSHTSVNTSNHGSGRPQPCPSKCQTCGYVALYSKRFCVSRVADGRDGLLVWSADAKTRNKQTWATSRRRSSITWLGKVFSCCGWTRRLPDMEGGCESNEQAVHDMLQRAYRQHRRWGRGKQVCAVKSQHVTKCYARHRTEHTEFRNLVSFNNNSSEIIYRWNFNIQGVRIESAVG
jgi:hypothetical protein